MSKTPGAPTIRDSSVHSGYLNAANDPASQALSGTAQAGSTVKVYLNGSTTPAYTAPARSWLGCQRKRSTLRRVRIKC
jgi:hypothetical protein